MYSQLLAQPKTTVVIMLIITAWFANVGSTFQNQIEDDVEIFLPEDADSTDLLLEVRSEWSTDIAIIYIQTMNAEDPVNYGNSSNISNVQIMHEISWIEGDNEYVSQPDMKYHGIDWDKEDHGRNDGVLWVISFPQIVKEINSSDGRFYNASCEGPGERISQQIVNCEALQAIPGNKGGLYAIPDEQSRIDDIVSRADGGFDSLVRDTNGDGVWDTTAVIIGMTHDMSITPHWKDYKGFFAHVDEIISEENRPQEYRQTEMTQTGLSKILEDVSDKIYLDLLDMLPISMLLTVLVITAIHRSWKVVVITGTPILMALSFTFGASVLLKLTLTPMIIATFPILIGLGVDYALHMVNRIEEVRKKRLDKAVEESESNRRKGQAITPIPEMWDPEFYRSCVMEMTRTTGVAVMLSAATTVVGFSVLIAPNIVSIIPIRSVGMTLVSGIAATLLFSIILVPTLSWLLKYSKRTNYDSKWGKISRGPIKYFYVTIIVALLITATGLYYNDEMSKPITGSDQTPDNIPSMEAMVKYSRTFSGGQTSLFIFDATKHSNTEEFKIRDLSVLDSMDALEQKIAEVEHTNTTSVITFLKAIPVSLTDPNTNLSLYEGTLWELLHEECWESNEPSCAAWIALDATSPDGKGREHLRKDMVNVAYDTLSKEVQWMLTNEGGNKALVYVTQPYINLTAASELRDEIDGMLNEPMDEPGIRVSPLTGGLPVSLDINKGIHDTQNYTTLLTLLILTIVLCIVFRSPRIGIYTMIPVATIIVWQPLLMKSGDVNVNIFTAMIGTIVFGIGVDDAIHVMHRIQEEGETAIGISHTIEKTGQTIFETTATTVAGLGAGFFVAFPGLENFFILMMTLICFAFLTSVFLLPACITCDHVVRNMISRERGISDKKFIDFGEVAVFTDENMEAVDAIIE
jgi:hypothetical protein